MHYSREVKGLSQNQAIENLRAIISSDYFKTYEFCNGRMYSDIISVNSIGGYNPRTKSRFKVGDVTDTLGGLLDGIENKGSLNEVFWQIALPDKKLKAMKFEKRLYEDDFDLPLTFSLQREGEYNAEKCGLVHKKYWGGNSDKYVFRVVNLGFKESYFESKGWDLKDANARLAKWYKQVNRNLKKILPHEVSPQGVKKPVSV